MKMNSKNVTIAIVGIAIVFVAVTVFLGVRQNGGSLSSLRDAGRDALEQQVPDLTLKNYEGENVSLREIEGEIVLLNSWAAWCPFCVNEIPDFVQAQEELGDQLTVVLINRQESLNRAKTFSDDLGAAGNVITLLDPSDSFYRGIGGFAMPETLLVKDGSVILHKRGQMSLRELKIVVRSALEST